MTKTQFKITAVPLATPAELLRVWRKRPYSWSQHSSFDYDKDQWFNSYILGARGDATPAMEFGKLVGDSFGTDTPMAAVTRYSHMEYAVKTRLGKIPLIGFIDSYDPVNKYLREYKTSSNAARWTQKSVDGHGQLTFYCLLLYLAEKVRPEDVTIHLEYIPVRETMDFSMEVAREIVPSVFSTKRTTRDVLQFAVEIKKKRGVMEAYAIKKFEASGLSTGGMKKA